MIVSLLKVRQLQTDQLGTPEATAQQEGQDGMISFAFRFASIRGLKKPAPLSAGKPVSEPSSSFFVPFTRLILAARSGLSKPLSEAS